MGTTNTKAKAPTPEPEATTEESKPERTTVSAPTQFDRVMAVITKAGPEGATLKAISEATGLGYRVVHNVTWRLEGSPAVRDNPKKSVKVGDVQKPDEVKAQRVGEGRTVKYAVKS